MRRPTPLSRQLLRPDVCERPFVHLRTARHQALVTAVVEALRLFSHMPPTPMPPADMPEPYLIAWLAAQMAADDSRIDLANVVYDNKIDVANVVYDGFHAHLPSGAASALWQDVISQVSRRLTDGGRTP